MADTTYQPGVYRQAGGNRFVVASSGSADVESGGEIDIEAGGQFKVSGTALVTTGAALVLSSGISKGVIYTTGTITGVGYIDAAETMTSAGGALSNYGTSILDDSTGATIAFTIAPVTGVHKLIFFLPGATTGIPVVTTTGTYDGTNSIATFSTGSTGLQALDMRAYSTSRWYIVSRSTAITLS